MDNLTYRSYLADPAIRRALDEEVRRLRQQAIDDFIVAPIGRAWRRLRRTAPVRAVPAVALSHAAAIDTTLQAGDTLCIDDAQGYDISAGSGCVWITQQDDSSDYVLGPYQTFHVSRNGTTLVHAFKQASVQIAWRVEPARPHSSTPGRGPAYHAFGAGLAPAA